MSGAKSSKDTDCAITHISSHQTMKYQKDYITPKHVHWTWQQLYDFKTNVINI